MTENPVKAFLAERKLMLKNIEADSEFNASSKLWVKRSMQRKYVYNFDWLGRPIIQYPADIVALQELIWQVKPDLIIETGVAHGGSLILSASILAQLELAEAVASGTCLDPKKPKRKVLGVDIDIRDHNRLLIEAHHLSAWIDLIEGDSLSKQVIAEVKQKSKSYQKIMVILDSNHVHHHVLAELKAFSDLVTVSSYCLVLDTFVGDYEEDIFPDRDWGPGDNPQTAVNEFLSINSNFRINKNIGIKLQITSAASGFLERIY